MRVNSGSSPAVIRMFRIYFYSILQEEEEEREANKPPMPSMDPESLSQPGGVEAMMNAQKGDPFYTSI